MITQTKLSTKNLDLTKTNQISLSEKTIQRLIAVACLGFFPAIYFIGKLVMQYLAS